MADITARLNIDSSKYDQKLKSAIEQMAKMEQEVRRTGATFAYADKEELEFVKSLGSMETKTTSAKSQLREYTEALMQMTSTYRNLTQEEKNSDWGKALAASMDEIKGKAAMLRDAMSDVNIEISGMASDTQVFDQIAGGVTGLVSVFQVGQGALQMFGVKNQEAMQAMARLQGVMAVTNGLTKIGTLLQKQSALMIGITTVQRKAAAAAENLDTVAKGKNIVVTKSAAVAQKTLNAVAMANPYVLLATAVVGVCTALFGLVKATRGQSDEEKRAQEIRERSQERWRRYKETIADAIGSVTGKYKLLQYEWNSLSSEEMKNNWIDENKSAFNELGISIKSVSDAENVFVQNSGKVIQALQLRAQAAALQGLAQEEYQEYYKTMQEYGGVVTEGMQYKGKKNNNGKGYTGRVGAGMVYAGELDPGTEMKNGRVVWTKEGAEEENKRREQLAGISERIANDYIELSNALEKQANNIFKEIGVKVDGSTSAPDPQKTLSLLEQRNERIQAINKSIEELNGVLASTADEETKAWATEELKKYQSELDRLNGKAKEALQIKGPSGYSQEGISAFRSEIQGSMKGMQMGSDEYMFQADRLVDLTTFENLLKTATENGIQPDPALLENLFETIDNAEFGVTPSISDDAWQTLVDQINEKLKELNLPPIELDVKTGGVKEAKNEMGGLTENVQGAIGVFGQLGSAMQQIEDPGAKVAGMIMEAIAGIAATFAASLKGTFTPWDWIAAAISGASTMIGVIASIKSATKGFASGGMVEGTSYSGDNIVARLNAGEGVLTAQGVQNAAMMADGAGQQRIVVEGRISGKDILLSANNTNRAAGGSRGYYTKVK